MNTRESLPGGAPTHRLLTGARGRALATGAGIASIALTACASPYVPTPDPDVARVAATSTDDVALARSLNTVGYAVFHAAVADGENTAVSPLSIGMAFGVLDAGASGDVAAALDSLYAYPVEGQARLDAFNALEQRVSLEGVRAEDSEFPQPAVVTLANRMFVDTNFAPNESYKETLAAYFGAGAQTEPLATNGGAAAEHINAWVNDRTNGLIPQLVDAGSFNSESRVTLVNTVYMKADWAAPFDAGLTADAPFTRLDGSEVTADLMHQDEMFGSAMEGDGWVAATLPYLDNELEMVLILPDLDRYDEVEASVDQTWMDNYDATSRLQEFDLAMPKFTTEGSIDLRGALEEVGADGLFDTVGLDGIGPNLYLSGAVHATKVIVDEKGTEAAAATALGLAGSAMPTEEPLQIRADHPFIYVIRDVSTGSVLFVGRVLDPS